MAAFPSAASAKRQPHVVSSVVTSSVWILISDFFLTKLLLV